MPQKQQQQASWRPALALLLLLPVEVCGCLACLTQAVEVCRKDVWRLGRSWCLQVALLSYTGALAQQRIVSSYKTKLVDVLWAHHVALPLLLGCGVSDAICGWCLRTVWQ
jgi:hypothetical protein